MKQRLTIFGLMAIFSIFAHASAHAQSSMWADYDRAFQERWEPDRGNAADTNHDGVVNQWDDVDRSYDHRWNPDKGSSSDYNGDGTANMWDEADRAFDQRWNPDKHPTNGSNGNDVTTREDRIGLFHDRVWSGKNAAKTGECLDCLTSAPATTQKSNSQKATARASNKKSVAVQPASNDSIKAPLSAEAIQWKLPARILYPYRVEICSQIAEGKDLPIFSDCVRRSSFKAVCFSRECKSSSGKVQYDIYFSVHFEPMSQSTDVYKGFAQIDEKSNLKNTKWVKFPGKK